MSRALLATVLSSLAVGAWAQGPPLPGPEHDVLATDVGEWDAVMKIVPMPGAPPMEVPGTEKNTLLGGRWLIGEFKSDMMGQPFEGHGITGYDPDKKAYVFCWVDSMSTTVSQGESTYDAASKTMTGWMAGKDPATGAATKMKSVSRYTDANTRVFELYPSLEASEPSMTITYTRKK
jgi:hypothetical protein